METVGPESADLPPSAPEAGLLPIYYFALSGDIAGMASQV